MTKRAILLAVLAGAAISAAPALAGLTYSFGPHVGPTRPGPHSRIGYQSDGTIELPGGEVRKLSDRCRFLRGEYHLRHATKPRALRAFHGCRLWRLDHDYHSSIDNLVAMATMSRNPSLAFVAQVELIIIRLHPGY